MSLAEYRTSDSVDVSLVDPLATRLLKVLKLFGGRVLIVSGRRSYAEQLRLWEQYLAGGNLAARPGTSNHEHGAAADLRIVDPSVTWAEVHNIGAVYGLWWPIPSEDWHTEAAPNFVEPEEDMTPHQLAHALGPTAELGLDGVIRLPLVNDDLTGTDMWPLAEALTFIHQELKMRRLAGQ